MSDAPSDPGTMLKLGFVVLCVGGCALGMLALRQAGLQAGHELAQTQLRIQKADEDLWKLRAEISSLAAPARIRELADELGPLHGLTPRPEAASVEASAATGTETSTVEQKPSAPTSKPAAPPAAKPGSKSTTPPNVKPNVKPSGKPEARPQPKQPAKPDAKPLAPVSGSQAAPKPAGAPTKPSSQPTATPPRPKQSKPERGSAPGVA